MGQTGSRSKTAARGALRPSFRFYNFAQSLRNDSEEIYQILLAFLYGLVYTFTCLKLYARCVQDNE